ncbi:MAG: hypothetical protein NTX15_04745 [Candidatus Kapabacteria bacterium]|nr:hypothetical protein [Candidatus Kapabacteria bacterium]
MKFRRRIFWLSIAVFFTAIASHAQTSIGGIVNIYAPVTDIVNADCASHITVPSSTAFRPKDLVLIIQMKGALQSGTYNTQAVGLFEFATIASITGNTINLLHPLLNVYDVNGRVQIVRVPVYADADVNQPLSGSQWNGTIGGVIVIDVRGTLRLNANISADGIGFRGGTSWRSGGACSTMTANDGINSQSAAMKGESYVDPQASNVSGRQELFSGGGGGVSHNSGGGGGGNGGAGGRGGAQWEGCSRFFDNGGLGGVSAPAVVNNTARIRCGGGGGAGQMNDNVGTGGANGGGIVIIRCQTLGGNARSITANGTRPMADAQNDGAGAGGAGGTVLLVLRNLVAGVFVGADGGRGGNVRTSAMHGPGGGGGGGSFLFSGANLIGGLTFSVTAGPNGRNVNQASAVNQAYLATPGDDGISSFGQSIPENTGQFPLLSVRAPRDTLVCPGTSISFTAKTTGTYSSIEWKRANGIVVSSKTDLQLVATSTQTYTVSITDIFGCVATDTVVVNVLNGWKIDFPVVNLNALGCTYSVDTALWLFNNSASDATITKVTSASPGVAITFPAPILLKPGERYRIPVAMSLPTNGSLVTASIDATITPCDTVVSTNIIVRRNDRTFDVNPKNIRMPSIVVCTATSRDTTLGFLFDGAAVDVVDVLEMGSSRILSAKRFQTVAGIPTQTRIRWLPSLGATAGRIGFVVRDGACLDTLWVDVDGPVSAPRITASPTVDVATLILCRNSRAEVDVDFTSADTTTWEVSDISIVGTATADIARGDRFVGKRTIRVSVVPAAVGPYEIVMTVRLLPCDTSVVIRIRGSAVNALSDGTPLLAYTENIVGRRQTLQAIYRNTGTADLRVSAIRGPQAPFTLLRTEPAIPCVLVPDAQMTAFVEIKQKVGVHRDSVVVTIDDPCLGSLTTQLEAEASARTVIAMPDIISRIGVVDTVPVLLIQRPQIDSVLLDEFTVHVTWKARELSIASGSDQRSRWTSRIEGEQFVVDIVGRWDGSDTLALLPVNTLLSYAAKTDLLFVREPGLLWTDQVSAVEYDDGTLTVDDPCAGRQIRTVQFSGIGTLAISPIPADEHLTLRLDNDRSHSISIEIIDVMGRIVDTHAGNILHECSYDISALPQGTFILRATIDGVNRASSFVVH